MDYELETKRQEVLASYYRAVAKGADNLAPRKGAKYILKKGIQVAAVTVAAEKAIRAVIDYSPYAWKLYQMYSGKMSRKEMELYWHFMSRPYTRPFDEETYSWK